MKVSMNMHGSSPVYRISLVAIMMQIAPPSSHHLLQSHDFPPGYLTCQCIMIQKYCQVIVLMLQNYVTAIDIMAKMVIRNCMEISNGNFIAAKGD